MEAQKRPRSARKGRSSLRPDQVCARLTFFLNEPQNELALREIYDRHFDYADRLEALQRLAAERGHPLI